WERRMRSIAAHPNVMCKLSGMITEADWRNWTLGHSPRTWGLAGAPSGPDLLFSASDCPLGRLPGSLGQVKGVVEYFLRGRPTAELEAIFGGNAVRFYGLKVQHGLTAQR